MRLGIVEHLAQRRQERRIGWVVGPQREHPGRVELRGEAAQSGGLVKRAVARVQQVARRMVDVQQHGVELPARRGRIEARFRAGGQREKVAVDEPAAGIGGEFETERNHATRVPFDDGFQCFDDEQRAHRRVFQGRARGVSEAQSADDHVPRRVRQSRQSQIGERDLDLVKQARHEKGVAEFHLEDFQAIQRVDAAAAQGQISERSMAMVEFGKVGAHGSDSTRHTVNHMRATGTPLDLLARLFAD